MVFESPKWRSKYHKCRGTDVTKHWYAELQAKKQQVYIRNHSTWWWRIGRSHRTWWWRLIRRHSMWWLRIGNGTRKLPMRHKNNKLVWQYFQFAIWRQLTPFWGIFKISGISSKMVTIHKCLNFNLEIFRVRIWCTFVNLVLENVTRSFR